MDRNKGMRDGQNGGLNEKQSMESNRGQSMSRYEQAMEKLHMRAEAMKENKGLYQEVRGKQRGNIRVLFGTTAAAAACAALVCGAYLGNAGGIRERMMGERAGETGLQTLAGEGVSGAAEKIENMFTLKVLAKEYEDGEEVVKETVLEPKKAVPLFMAGNKEKSSYVLGTGEIGENGEGDVYFTLAANLECEGNDIESVTYSINNALFQVVQPKDSSILLNGEEAEPVMTGMIGGDMTEYRDEAGNLKYSEIISDNRYYKSFTVAYDKQSGAHTWINICNDSNAGKRVQDALRLFGEAESAEDCLDAYNELLDGVEIICTANYTDGTSASAKIAVNAAIVPLPPLQPGEHREGPEWQMEKTVEPVFELQ